jgi:hypothetical protein
MRYRRRVDGSSWRSRCRPWRRSGARPRASSARSPSATWSAASTDHHHCRAAAHRPAFAVCCAATACEFPALCAAAGTGRWDPGETTHWTAPALAKQVGISISSVQRIWRAHGLQPHWLRQFKLSDAPRRSSTGTGAPGPADESSRDGDYEKRGRIGSHTSIARAPEPRSWLDEFSMRQA